MRSSAEIISDQQMLLDAVIRPLIAPGQPYALVDFPDHSNVGDSAIWIGERRLLANCTGRPPSYVDAGDPSAVDAIVRRFPEGPIFIHGGGNLGDIWPEHQHFREELLRRTGGRQIIQLPQSVHFRDAEGYDRFAQHVAAHGDFHLFVRDRSSEVLARAKLDCSVTLVPDSAIWMGSQHGFRRPGEATVALLRTDAEAVEREDLAWLGTASIVDWLDEPTDTFKSARATAVRRLVCRGRWRHQHRLLELYDALAERRVRRGLHLLGAARRLVTNRLHGHILGLLLDVPQTVLDNSYGKVQGYIDAWTSDYEHLDLAPSPGDVTLGSVDGQ